MGNVTEEHLIQALERQFNQHRIVVWYDSEKKLREFFEQVNIPDVTKLEIKNNEFGLKYRILWQEPEEKFLIFKEGPRPDDIDNWLLDIELANHEFRANQASIWMSDLGLGPEYVGIFTDHAHFFESRDRRNALKPIMDRSESERGLLLKMLAVCTRSHPDFFEIIESLLTETAREKDEDIRCIEHCSLHTILWKELKRRFGYESASPSMKDFAIQLFETAFAIETGEEGHQKLSQEIMIFIQRWQSSKEHHTSFEELSGMSDEILRIHHELPKLGLEKTSKVDSFMSAEDFVSGELMCAVADRTINTRDCRDIISRRRRGYWFGRFEKRYDAALECLSFFQVLNDVTLNIDTFDDGIKRYSSSWFRVDRHYRKALYALRKVDNDTIIQKLTDDIRKAYLNKYLVRINDDWQKVIESSDFRGSSFIRQNDFYRKKVLPFPTNRNKVAVIISDALRFEAGVELADTIRREDRYEASVEPMVAMLPSYTALGMAALLPHDELRIEKTGNVLADGRPTSGTQNRNYILSSISGHRAAAIKSEEFNNLGKEESRSLVRDHDVLFIYHNRIDSVGDKRDTEERVVEAVAETIDDIMALIKKLATANISNMLVTADHGFLYQDQPVENTDFIELDDAWLNADRRDRRFILGTSLPEHSGIMKRTAHEFGLEGNVEIAIPKSINRLRLQGSGSRFVHGGATLQEMIIPVISVNKKRKSDITYVDVDIMQKGPNRITTGQVSAHFYQLDTVSDKVHPRNLTAGIYDSEDHLLSQQEELIFDVASNVSDDRIKTITFRLTADVSGMNNQEVYIKLKEREDDTSYFKDYKSRPMILQTRFERDF